MKNDRRRTPSDGKSSHCLWKGELKRTKIKATIYKTLHRILKIQQHELQFKNWRCTYLKKSIRPPFSEISQTFANPPRWELPIAIIPIKPPITTNVWNVSVHNTARNPPWKYKIIQELHVVHRGGMIFSATFNSISAISWRSVVFV